MDILTLEDAKEYKQVADTKGRVRVPGEKGKGRVRKISSVTETQSMPFIEPLEVHANAFGQIESVVGGKSRCVVRCDESGIWFVVDEKSLPYFKKYYVEDSIREILVSVVDKFRWDLEAERWDATTREEAEKLWREETKDIKRQLKEHSGYVTRLEKQLKKRLEGK